MHKEMTNDELRQEFEDWKDCGMREAYNIAFATNAEFKKSFHNNLDDELERARQWGFELAYQACNAKRQEEMARLKALLRECEIFVYDCNCSKEKRVKLHKKLQAAGYGNE
jgi:hypothetical protein